MKNLDIAEGKEIKRDNPCIYNVQFSNHNETQNEAIRKFRALLNKDENDITSDNDVCRFLAAREWKAQDAAKMRKLNLKMRRNYQFDRYHVNNDYNQPRHKSAIGLRKLLITGINNGCIGRDKSGNPVAYSHFGTFISLPLYKYITIDEYMLWHNAHFEALIQNQMNKSKSAQFLLIIDLDQIGLQSRHNSLFIRACCKSNEAHYPEYFYRVLCINAPKIVSILYNLIKPILPERTKHKVSFYDHKSTPNILQKFIDKQYLPSRYGGFINDNDCWTKVHPNPEKILKELRLDLACDTDQVAVLKVKPGKNKLISFNVPPDSIIKWWFVVQSHDIGFCVKWKESRKNEMEFIRQKHRCGNEGYGTEKFPVHDEFKSVASGTILFEFSNKHSSFKSKRLEYNITIE